MRNRMFCLSVIVCIGFIVGCKTKPAAPLQYDKPLAPGKLALRKITDPARIPDFALACRNLFNLSESTENSLAYLSKPSSETYFPYGEITHAHMVASLEHFNRLLKSGLRNDPLKMAINRDFDFYESVGCDNRGTVLFTGYYTPIFDGASKQGGRFQYPLYKQPEDLVKGPDGTILGRRLQGGQVGPYPARAEIEAAGMLKGSELVWLTDKFEAYIAHVQGSAKIRMPDGTLMTIGYAANNGHDYKSIRSEMIADGLISAEEISLGTMIDYFKRAAGKVDTYVNRNPRYVFFRKEEGQPRGSLNAEVIPMRSLATDKSVYPRAGLTFFSTILPQKLGAGMIQRPYQGFALDQDTGGAIRAPGRCDIYMGQGDIAGNKAGQTCREGKLYYLFLKQGLRPMTPTALK